MREHIHHLVQQDASSVSDESSNTAHFNVWRSPVGVHRSPFAVRRLAFGVWRSVGALSELINSENVSGLEWVKSSDI
jgi:hypothetical protein